MSKYISSPTGICKIITAVLGIIVCILAVVSWPRDLVTWSNMELWKYYIFLAFSVNALGYSVSTLVFLAFRHKASGVILKLDAGLSIIVGVILTLTAAQLLQEVFSQYHEISNQCEMLVDSEGNSQNALGISRLLGIRSEEDGLESAKKCIETYGSTDREHSIKACRCWGRYLIKFGTSVAAGVIALLNFVALGATAGLSLKG